MDTSVLTKNEVKMPKIKSFPALSYHSNRQATIVLLVYGKLKSLVCPKFLLILSLINLKWVLMEHTL